MTRYYQRPIVEAVQWTGDNYDEIRDIVDGRYESISHDARLRNIEIWSGGRSWYAVVGNWVTRQPECVRVWTDAAFREQHEQVAAEPTRAPVSYPHGSAAEFRLPTDQTEIN